MKTGGLMDDKSLLQEMNRECISGKDPRDSVIVFSAPGANLEHAIRREKPRRMRRKPRLDC